MPAPSDRDQSKTSLAVKIAAIAAVIAAGLLGAGVAVLTNGSGNHPPHATAGALPPVTVEVRPPERPATPSALAAEPAATQAPTHTTATASPEASPVSTATTKSTPPPAEPERPPPVVRE